MFFFKLQIFFNYQIDGGQSIKLPIVIKIFVLSIFEWPFYTGFTVLLTGIKHYDP